MWISKQHYNEILQDNKKLLKQFTDLNSAYLDSKKPKRPLIIGKYFIGYNQEGVEYHEEGKINLITQGNWSICRIDRMINFKGRALVFGCDTEEDTQALINKLDEKMEEMITRQNQINPINNIGKLSFSNVSWIKDLADRLKEQKEEQEKDEVKAE